MPDVLLAPESPLLEPLLPGKLVPGDAAVPPVSMDVPGTVVPGDVSPETVPVLPVVAVAGFVCVPSPLVPVVDAPGVVAVPGTAVVEFVGTPVPAGAVDPVIAPVDSGFVTGAPAVIPVVLLGLADGATPIDGREPGLMPPRPTPPWPIPPPLPPP